MLRKVIYLLLALIGSALVLVSVHIVRHAMALERLEEKHASLGHWRYRVVNRPASGPDNLFGESRAWRARLIARPDLVVLYGKKLDEPMLRELALVRMADLCLQNCEGLTPAVMTDLSRIASLRKLAVGRCDTTDEALNLVWSRMPDLESMDVTNVPEHLLSEAGFRDIRQAKQLRRLDLRGNWQNIDQVIAQISQAPALEMLNIEYGGDMEACATQLASMPALKEVRWIYHQPPAAFMGRLKALQPRVKLISIRDKEL